MMKKTSYIFFIITLLHSVALISMECPKTHLLVIPGQNGMGGQNVHKVLPYFADNKHLMHHVKTPLSLPDFGQSRCQQYLKDKIDLLKTNSKLHDYDHLILHGSSQGTATTINYTAHNPQNIKAIILESVLLTGNSAIFHTVDNVMLSDTCDLPDSSYYLLPYTAKTLYPCYSPSGEQPINNIDKLPTDLLTIIVHDTKDFQLSSKDAQALYAYLTLVRGNKNVYLFAQESMFGEHINLLKEDNKEEINAINTILKIHNLLPVDSSEMLTDLSEFQPTPQPEWLDHFDAIFNKEKNIQTTATTLQATSTSLSLYALGKWVGIL
jgi:hypothetical protein